MINNSKSSNVCDNTLSILSRRYSSELYMGMHTDTLGMVVRLLLIFMLQSYCFITLHTTLLYEY